MLSKILKPKDILMKKTKKLFKVLFIIIAIFMSATLVGSIVYYKFITHGISLDTNKLELQNPIQTLTIFDSNLNKIKPNKESYIYLSKLSTNTKNAFICAEDKRFYKHKGVDLIRIGGAVLSNLKSKSFSEGASTISQQLVKNTQLSNEKTINRKLKEIKLTKELENTYSKNEIFELYLNKIYFGNGCYGIENASWHYFSKSASELTLAESALLAGAINAPSFYDIENNLSQATDRRNLILSLMKKYNKISNEEFIQAKNENPKLNISDISGNQSIYKNIIAESCKILKTTETKLNNSNLKIYTALDSKLNEDIKHISNSYKSDSQKATIVIDNKSHLITGIFGNNKILNTKWQPGSTIKPILVYAPAIEKGQISPATKILDNKINISGYSPENADKNYHGYISCKTALSKSYNIPAVKILNELGISEAKSFAEKLGITFEESDNHLALALGGFETGVTPKILCDAYSCFSRLGKFSKSSYIKKITKEGKTIYENKNQESTVMSESTAFLINDILLECSKTGTAKRLSSLEFPVCSKTGTVGKTNSSKNQLAYNISYTPNHTVLTLIQGENLPENINGSTHPTMINKEILQRLYKNQKPETFKPPKSVKLVNLDKTNYSQNKLLETDSQDSIKEYFKIENLPPKASEKNILTVINTPYHKPQLCFTINKNCNYSLIREQKNKEEIIYFSPENNENFINFTDKTVKNNEIYTYKLKICDKSKNEEFFSNEIKLRTYCY